MAECKNIQSIYWFEEANKYDKTEFINLIDSIKEVNKKVDYNLNDNQEIITLNIINSIK